MSGGSWDYECYRLEDLARRLSDQSDIRRRHLAIVVRGVAKALHDIEWVDSGDYAPGDEHAAIDAVTDRSPAAIVQLVDSIRADCDYLMGLAERWER